MPPPPLFQRVIALHISITYVKGILDQGGKAPRNKLKDMSFNFSMTNVIYCSIIPMHAQKEDITLLDFKSTSILNFSALLLFEKSNTFTHSVVETVPSLKTKMRDGARKCKF